MKWNRLLYIQIQTLPPSLHHIWNKIMDIVSKTDNEKIIGDRLLLKGPIELKDIFN
jgi:hypothetical protein